MIDTTTTRSGVIASPGHRAGNDRAGDAAERHDERARSRSATVTSVTRAERP